MMIHKLSHKVCHQNCVVEFHLKALVTQKKLLEYLNDQYKKIWRSESSKTNNKDTIPSILEQKLSSDISNWYLYVLCPPVRLTVSCNPFAKLDEPLVSFTQDAARSSVEDDGVGKAFKEPQGEFFNDPNDSSGGC